MLTDIGFLVTREYFWQTLGIHQPRKPACRAVEKLRAGSKEDSSKRCQRLLIRALSMPTLPQSD